MEKKKIRRCVSFLKNLMNNSFLLEYLKEIEKGNITVGLELYQELKNLEDDIKHDDEYIFIPERVAMRLKFIEGVCKLTKAPYYGKPMKLILWERAFLETVYGFVNAKELKDNNKYIDRFKKVLLMIGRKNGKTEFDSAVGLSEWTVGQAGSQIVCASMNDENASIAFDTMDVMREIFDPKSKDTHRNRKGLKNKVTSSMIFKMSDEQKHIDGKNIDFALLDEVHELKTNRLYKAIEQSQSIKENPKIIMITTNGFITDGFLDEELAKARAIINGEDTSLIGRRFLPWLYTQDNEEEIWQDESSWIKSNPSLGQIKRLDYLREQVDLAKKSKSDRIFVLAKDFNIHQNTAESWLNQEEYDYPAVFDLEEFRGSYCLASVDLAETTDLCNVKVLLMRKGDRVKYVYSHYFIPSVKIGTDEEAGAKYEQWLNDGYITIAGDNMVDESIIANWFYTTLYQEHGIMLYKLGYDQKFALSFINQMVEFGWQKNTDLIMLQQGTALGSALRKTETDFSCKYINYNENPVDKWCLENAKLKVDSKGFGMLVKAERQKRIDGAVTLVMLEEMYSRYANDFNNLLN